MNSQPIRIEEPEDWMLKRDKLTLAQWRTRKRREMDAVLKALDVALNGAFYTPSDGSDNCIGEAFRICRAIRERMRVKNWPLPKKDTLTTRPKI